MLTQKDFEKIYHPKKYTPTLLKEIKQIYPVEELEKELQERSLSFSEWFYLKLHGLSSAPICPVCNIAPRNFIGIRQGYTPYCGYKCAANSSKTKEKRSKTCMKKYGVANVTQSKKIKAKSQATLLKKYWVTHPSKSKEIQKKVKETFAKKYGGHPFTNKEIQEKIKKTILERYWVEHSSLSKEIRAKQKETLLKNYGVVNPSQAVEIKERKKKTTLKNYGVTNPSLSKEVLAAKRKNNLEKYGAITPEKKRYIERYLPILGKYVEINKELEEQIELFYKGEKDREDSSWGFVCKKCGNKFQDKLSKPGLNNCVIPYEVPRCLECYPKKAYYGEKEVGEYIESLIPAEEVVQRDRKVLGNRELDLYIPSKSLAIEFNGIAFHSFGKNKNSLLDNALEEKQKKYAHLEKTQRCEIQGIQLLHLFENEWLDPIKKDIWKSIIAGKLGTHTRVYARKLALDLEVSSREAQEFLEEHHLQGTVPSKKRIGLRDSSGELYMLVTLGKPRYGKDSHWELLRLATKKYITVVGGVSKIYKYVREEVLKEGETLVTYADKRYSQGAIYSKLGMECQKDTPPNYFYFLFGEYHLQSRINFQKHKLSKLLDSYDEKLTETENMYNNRYRKIYDCGNKKYIYIKIS